MKNHLSLFNFPLLALTSSLFCSCIVGQNPISSSTNTSTTRKPVETIPNSTNFEVPNTISLCNLKIYGKHTIYQFNGSKVNSGTVANLKLPNGNQRFAWQPGTQPRFQYTPSKTGKTAELTLYLMFDNGNYLPSTDNTLITKKVSMQFKNSSEGTATIRLYQSNKLKRTMRATFFAY